MEVHNLLGPGVIASVYRLVGKHRLDVIVSGEVVVELKAVGGIADVHMAQAPSYLKASGLELALILNFGEPRLSFKRGVKSRTFATTR